MDNKTIDQLIDTIQKLEYLIECVGHGSLLMNLDSVVSDMGYVDGFQES